MAISSKVYDFQKEIGDQELYIYQTFGVVHSIKEFLTENIKCFEKCDYDLIRRSWNFFDNPIPPELNRCITRSFEFRTFNGPIALIKRSGARSALWDEKGYKFKGCRPVLDHALFPMETLIDGNEHITYANIPFGVLTKEAVLREILAFAFQKEFQIDQNTVPLCIYEYKDQTNNTFGYCLVQKSFCEKRIEEFIDYPEISYGSVIGKFVANQTDDLGHLYGMELGLKGINNWWYAEEKAKLLIRFHFNGGFRGILNSNIGNDIIYMDGSKRSLFLCDFDTFKYTEIPTVANLDFLKSFVLRCLIEVSKGSLSIFEFIKTPDNMPKAEIAQILSNAYFTKSTLWKAYKRMFDNQVMKKGWNIRLVEEAFDYSIKTQAFLDVVALNTLNNYYLDHLSSTRNIYYSHN
jgi:hypothetical protein